MKGKTPTFEQDVAALLDALTAELLAAPDGEVENSLHESGAKGRGAAEAVRCLIAAADPDAEIPSISGAIDAGRRSPLARDH